MLALSLRGQQKSGLTGRRELVRNPSAGITRQVQGVVGMARIRCAGPTSQPGSTQLPLPQPDVFAGCAFNWEEYNLVRVDCQSQV
jgi:hypothetical protein